MIKKETIYRVDKNTRHPPYETFEEAREALARDVAEAQLLKLAHQEPGASWQNTILKNSEAIIEILKTYQLNLELTENDLLED